jgi:hexosaminidase
MQMKLLSLLFLSFIFQNVHSQNKLNIVPKPVELKINSAKEKMIVSKNITLVLLGSGMEKLAAYFNDRLNVEYGFKLKISKSTIATNSIELNYERMDIAKVGAYNIIVSKNRIEINGDNEVGLFNAIQTFFQLPEQERKLTSNNHHQLSIPQLSITDYPRFNYRGMHLDVSRHFMPVDLVKRYIDYLAMYKFNTFHWHLTDDQGWRIEIKKYPKLTEVGGWRNGTIVGAYPGTGNDSIRYGGFYTQEEIKDVVKYAAARYITVVPEIEMPGHASAAIAAYPQLSCFPDEDTKYPAECVWAGETKGKQVQQTWGVFEDVFCPSDYTFNFLQDVLDEVVSLFPSQYIHVGGDECPKDSWKRSPFCQQLMKDKGLKDEHELQSYFIQRIEKYINSKGKKIIGWDEILEGGLAPNAAVMSWRGEAGGIAAAKQKHNVVMTPEYPMYLNHSQTKNEDSITQGGYNPLDAVYNYEPIPKKLSVAEGKYILGAQGNMWSEYIDSKSKLEYSLFPRMAALAEVLWSPKEKRNWKDFERRLPVILERLDSEKINYSKAYYSLGSTVSPGENFDGLVWQLDHKLKKGRVTISPPGIFIPKSKLSKGDSALVYNNKSVQKDFYRSPLKITKAGFYRATLEDSTVVSDYPVSEMEIRFNFNKATGKKITISAPPDAKYPGEGAFTLVNGIHNTAGLSKSSDFLGFNGKNCEAIIDLGKDESISKVTVHALNQNGDWIWKPSTTEVLTSVDGITFRSAAKTNEFIKTENTNGVMVVNFTEVNTRFVKVVISNWGKIPAGNSGSGNPAWVFVDEIEVE